jgi:hypothetical protein
MSDEDLELLITLDDPGEPQEEYTFNHRHAENPLEFWLGQPFSGWCRLNGCVIEQPNRNFDILVLALSRTSGGSQQ